jgi:phage terminase large subunit
LKEKVKEQKGIDVDHQKIVYKGKATNNADVLAAIGVKENDFMVVMTVIKKPETKPKEE